MNIIISWWIKCNKHVGYLQVHVTIIIKSDIKSDIKNPENNAVVDVWHTRHKQWENMVPS